MTTAEAYSTRYLTVDSRDRDPDLFPSPARFDVVLEEEMRCVYSIGLRAWNVPRVLPVTQGANRLWVEDASGAVSVAIAPYAYRSEGDASGFLAALSAAATAAAGPHSGQSFVISASPGGIVTVSSQSPFSIYSGDPGVAVWAEPVEPSSMDDKLFERKQPSAGPRFASGRLGDGYGTGSVARALGLLRGKTNAVPDGSGGFSVVAPNPNSLNSPVTSYIRLADIHAFEATAAGITTGAGGCMAIVDETPGCNKFSTGATIVEKCFHPPLGRLHRISVSVVDYFGVPLETENREIRLDFTVNISPSNASEGERGRGFGINNLSKKQQYEYWPEGIKGIRSAR